MTLAFDVGGFVTASFSCFGGTVLLSDFRSIDEKTCIMRVRLPPADLWAPVETAWNKRSVRMKAQWDETTSQLRINSKRPLAVPEGIVEFAHRIIVGYNAITNQAKFSLYRDKLYSTLVIQGEGILELQYNFCSKLPTYCVETEMDGIEIAAVICGKVPLDEDHYRPRERLS